jgi:hypothetical protein
MNRKQQSMLLAGLLAMVLAGCSSTRGSSEEMGGATGSGMGASGTSGTSGTSGSMGSGGAGGTSGGGSAASGGYDSQGGAGSTAGTGSGSMAAPAPAQGAGSSMAPGGMPNGVVMTIEVVPRQGAAGAGAGGTSVGGSGTTGTTGSSMGEDKMYRITLRMDDGSTRVVTQDKAPTFRSGDRVNMTDGMITQ